MADRSQELFLTAARQAALTDALFAAVELVLREHVGEIAKPVGEQDPELANLAAAYRDLTGWDAKKEAPAARSADEQDDRTCRWPRPVIHVDPAVSWGRPMVGGAPIASVTERILAGEGVMDVADDYGINRRQALTACWWAGAHDDDFADWWARWADETHTALATADDADTVCEHIPDPPAMTDDVGEDEADHRPVEVVPVREGLL